jgi:MFS family permease
LAARAGYAAATGAASLFFVRLAHGVGMGLLPTAAIAMVADTAPPSRRAEILGVFGIASSLALALGPATGVVLARALGFTALFAGAAVVGAIGLACVAVMPETLTVRETRRFRLADTMSRTALFPSVLMLAMTLTYGGLITFLPLHAAARDVNPGVFFVAYALALGAARQPAGRISDRWGRAPVAVVGLVVMAGALLLLAGAGDARRIVAGGIVYGAGHGIAHPVLVAWAAEGASAAQRGRAIGTLYTALELGIAAGSTAAGIGVARAGFTATFVVAAGIALATAALAATRVRRA